MTEVALYSVVSYAADQVRGEYVTVGVIVASGYERAIVCFPDSLEQEPVIRRFRGLLDHLTAVASHDRVDAEDLLNDLTDRRFSNFRISAPALATRDESIEQLAHDLLSRWVRAETQASS